MLIIRRAISHRTKAGDSEIGDSPPPTASGPSSFFLIHFGGSNFHPKRDKTVSEPYYHQRFPRKAHLEFKRNFIDDPSDVPVSAPFDLRLSDPHEPDVYVLAPIQTEGIPVRGLTRHSLKRPPSVDRSRLKSIELDT
ncbi:hypothetical protein GWI33_016851 [Rhynchophorus ferrugineus]|uniref:Uncharacterized protein n=1 Tax=Rhynchophorus ferrugineus TaxID=354439 RepID=A0A834M2Y6_RHYFE|nr:hypothetical protein GWI33_016851 [Rhynchophorus ferrugineus]